MVSGSCKRLDLAGGGGGAGDRQRAGDAIGVARAVPRFPRPCGDLLLTGHRRELVREIPHMGKCGSRARTPCFPAADLPFMRGRPMPTEPPLLFVPVGSNAARLFGMDARTRACRLATNAGFECADSAEPGRRYADRQPRLCLGPGLAESDGGAAVERADARREARSCPRSGRRPGRRPGGRGDGSRRHGGAGAAGADRRRDLRTQLRRIAQARAAVRDAARPRRSGTCRARRLRRVVQGRHRCADAVFVAQAGLPFDPLGGAKPACPRTW